MEPWYHVLKSTLLPPVKLWFNWRLEGLERIPPDGPVIVAGNHISYVDPFAHAHFVLRSGRRPRFLGKAELFDNPLTGWPLRGAGQIPVRRGSGDQTPLEEAARALEGGEAVVIYPEGTVTGNPDFSPMKAKTGLARLALTTGAPVVPVAVWGAQHVWQKSGHGSLAFGRPIWLKAGPPLDLRAEVGGAEANLELLRGLTAIVMAELAGLVEDLRSRYPKRWA